MFRIVKAELYKLFHSKAFKVSCGLALVLAVVITAMTATVTEESYMNLLGDIPQEEKLMQLEAYIESSKDAPVVAPGQLGFQALGMEDPFNMTPVEIFQSSFGVGVMEVLIGVLVASLFAREYSSGTLKNILAYGKKREEFYVSKFMAIVLGTAIVTAILVFIPTVVVSVMEGNLSSIGINQILEMVKVYFGAIVLYSAIIAILMLIVTIVKSKGATIGISVLLFIFVPTFLAFAYGQTEWFDKIFELTIFYNTSLVTAIKATNQDMLQAIAVGFTTLLVCGAGGMFIFKKQDIK